MAAKKDMRREDLSKYHTRPKTHDAMADHIQSFLIENLRRRKAQAISAVPWVALYQWLLYLRETST
jgi:hypothetical protein